MCCKADEIQNLWDIKNGDFYVIKKSRKAKLFILNYWKARDDISEPKSLFFWIPRLDQLQEMIDWTKWECSIIKRKNFEFRYKNIDGEQRQTFVTGDTLEQVWLAFVMSERYGKVWDEKNEEWKLF